jgi:hypothetical protein
MVRADTLRIDGEVAMTEDAIMAIMFVLDVAAGIDAFASDVVDLVEDAGPAPNSV